MEQGLDRAKVMRGKHDLPACQCYSRERGEARNDSPFIPKFQIQFQTLFAQLGRLFKLASMPSKLS